MTAASLSDSSMSQLEIASADQVPLSVPLQRPLPDGRLERSADFARPLRTMFVITSMPVGGAETLLVSLIDRLDPRRIIPEVICLKEPGPLGQAIADRHPVHSQLLSGKWDLRVLPRLTSLLRRRQADAVITVGAGDKMFWGRLAARLAAVPVVCSAIHSTGWPDGISRLNRWLTPITDSFIAVAENHGQHLIEQERFPADRVTVIRNGIDCDRFVPSDTALAALCRQLSLPTDSRLVGIVAALRPEKNHEMFVDVAAAVCAAESNVHFVIVGDGPQRSVIQHQVDSLGLTDRVHLLGTRHDTPQIVAAMDVFLLCSHNEASPVSILEALACGVPVISTQVGSVSESVRPGVTGYLVQPDDRGEMSRRLRQLLADSALRQRLGDAGRRRVLETGSLAAMVDGYSSLVHRLYWAKTQAGGQG